MTSNPDIRAELERIALAHGGILKPEIVVASARAEESPLHGHFDWDDSEAAEKWRILQARNLIRVVVSYELVGDGKLVPCRVFVSLTPDREEDGGGYRVTTAVLGDSDMRRQLLLDARKEMGRFREKYAHLAELAKVFEAMEQVETKEPAMETTGAL